MRGRIRYLQWIPAVALWVAFAAAPVPAQVICGDGDVEGAEECDDGASNSDLAADACRTNCTRAACGDGVVDRDEACDEGRGNSDEIPGRCRLDCSTASCGDGVVDPDEACDDLLDPDGCHQCRRCVAPKSGLVLTSDTQLCPGRYELIDGGNGALRVEGQGLLIDCDGTVLVGRAPQSAESPRAGRRQAAAASPRVGIAASALGKVSAVRPRAGARPKAATVDPSLLQTTDPHGTGIVVAAPNVVVRGCRLSNFVTGIAVNAEGAVLLDNHVCRNDRDVIENGPVVHVRNTCDAVVGKEEDPCAATCDG